MPYCIQCGVKLNDRYNKCPLCQIELEYSNKQQELPPLYPKEINRISIIKNKKNQKDWLTIHFIGFITFLIVFLTSGIDYFMNKTLTWSIFTTTSTIYIYLSLSTLLNLKKNPYLLYITLNSLLGFFIFSLDVLTNNSKWFIIYALPCLISLQILSLIILILFKFIHNIFLRTIIIIITTDIFFILINEITTSVSWALITSSIFLPTAAYLIYLYIKIQISRSYQ